MPVSGLFCCLSSHLHRLLPWTKNYFNLVKLIIVLCVIYLSRSKGKQRKSLTSRISNWAKYLIWKTIILLLNRVSPVSIAMTEEESCCFVWSLAPSPQFCSDDSWRCLIRTRHFLYWPLPDKGSSTNRIVAARLNTHVCSEGVLLIK